MSSSVDPAASHRRRRWLAAGLLSAWVVALVAAGAWSAHHGPASVREQSDLQQGRQTLDQAVATVVTAAGPAVTAAVADYQVTVGCRITMARDGTEVEQVVALTVPDGQERALLDRLADRLPADWQPQVFGGTARLGADAGDFVSVSGTSAGPGQVQVKLSTGCRPGDDPQLIPDPAASQ